MSPWERKDDMPPAGGSSTVAKIAADVRPQSAHLWWPVAAKLRAASVPIA